MFIDIFFGSLYPKFYIITQWSCSASGDAGFEPGTSALVRYHWASASPQIFGLLDFSFNVSSYWTKLYVVRCTVYSTGWAIPQCVLCCFFGCFLPPWVRSSQKYNRRWSPVDRRDSWVEMNQLLIILKKNLLNLIFI